MPSLKGMNVEALVNLRNQVEKRLLECRAELEKQLAALDGQSKAKSFKGTKVPPKYSSPSGGTWAGRGMKPKWMVAAMKKGKKVDDFLIDKSARKGRRAKR